MEFVSCGWRQPAGILPINTNSQKTWWRDYISQFGCNVPLEATPSSVVFLKEILPFRVCFLYRQHVCACIHVCLWVRVCGHYFIALLCNRLYPAVDFTSSSRAKQTGCCMWSSCSGTESRTAAGWSQKPTARQHKSEKNLVEGEQPHTQSALAVGTWNRHQF